MCKYKLKFMFEWGSGVCLWSVNDEARQQFMNYPIKTNQMPISETLQEKLENLIAKHDEALDWSNPGGDLLWDDYKVDSFLKEAKSVYYELCSELGHDYEIELISSM